MADDSETDSKAPPSASTARWADLLDPYPEAIAIHVGRKIAYANAAAAALVGADSAEQLIGMDSLGFVDDSFRRQITERLDELNEVPPVPYQEICIRRLDGSMIWIRLQPVQIVYGGHDALHTVLVDVTEECTNRISLRRRNSMITAAAHIGASLLRVIEVEAVLEDVLREIRVSSGATCVILQRTEGDARTGYIGRSAADASCPTVHMAPAPALALASAGKPVYGKPADLVPEEGSLVDMELMAITPLRIADQIVGAITLVFEEEVPGWSDGDMATLSVIGSAIGHAFERERIETRRRKSERKFRRIIEQASDGIVISKPDGTFIDANEAACRLTGYRCDELLALSPADLITSESLEERPLDWATLRPGEVRRHERVLRRKGGTTFIAELSVTKNDDGFVQVIARDISDRVAYERAVIESRDRLQLAVESGKMGIWDLDLTTGSVTWTPETAAIFGVSIEEFDGRLDTVKQLIHPDDLHELERITQRAVDSLEEFTILSRLTRPDGPATWIRSQGRILSEEGRATRMIGTIIDVSGEVQSERSIRRKSARIQGMLVALPDLVVRVIERKDGTIRIGAYRGQRSRDTLEARSLHMPLPQRVRDQYEQSFAILGRRDEAETFSYALSGADGESKIFEVRMARSGEREAVAVVRDVTLERQRELELVHARDEAEDMSRLKSSFLANMSHEIRTPLTSIIGFSDILAEQLSEDSAEFMQIIRTSGERLMHTMNSVLDLAQIESGTVDLDVRPSDLRDRIRTAVEFYEPQAQLKGIELRLEVDLSKPLPAVVDAQATDRILAHILSNALKFTTEGSITLRAWSENGSSIVSVSDTGIGMSERFQRRLFQPFYQESSGLARDYEGIGLGLTISRHLVGLMGATIEVSSERGMGSIFTIRFPEAQPGRSVERASVDSSLPRTDGERRRHVLVVDDDEITRILVSQVLEDEFDVTTVASGEEAVDSVRRHTPDAMLLDVSLEGGIGGEDVVRKLRRLGYDDLPIIAVTGFTRTGDRERFFGGGFDGYVSKPFRREHLIAALRLVHHAATPHENGHEDLPSLLERCRELGLIDSYYIMNGHVMLRQDIAYMKLPEERAFSALQVMLENV